MIGPMRRLLAIASAGFFVAAAIHSDLIPIGYAHAGAWIPESIIGAVLLVGLGLTWPLAAHARAVALAALGFALIGDTIGVYVSIIGVGPSTLPDRVFHVGMVGLLLWGLVVAVRSGRPDESARVSAMRLVRVLLRAVFLVQLALGLTFWTGNLLVAVPFHIFNGVLLVVLVEAQALLAAPLGLARPLALLTMVWGFLVVAFGLTHAGILPGALHWIVEIAHLVVGVAAIGLAERLARVVLRPPGR